MRNKSKHKVFRIMIFIIIFLTIVYSFINKSYINKKKAYYQPKQSNIISLLQEEKDWIKLNQGSSGELYMNSSDVNKNNGSVVPYFACQSLMGILVDQPSEADLNTVANYLNWHTSKLLEAHGEITNYNNINGKLISSGKYDSVDSYLAMYLILIAEYYDKGGEISSIENWQDGISMAFRELDKITFEGLTQVSLHNKTKYLMDNCEVYEAYDKMSEFLSTDDVIRKWKHSEKLLKVALASKDSLKKSVSNFLWDEEHDRFEIGLNGNGQTLGFKGWNVFYPCSIAQMYPFIGGVFKFNNGLSENLYNKLCKYHSWEQGSVAKDDFMWMILSYVAIKNGDVEKTLKYLNYYEDNAVRSGRKYPTHTAEAGWVCRTYGGLLEYYEKRINSGLITDWFNHII